ncbi:hypothetical protein PS15p_211256 [Mucor circinelloides]
MSSVSSVAGSTHGSAAGSTHGPMQGSSVDAGLPIALEDFDLHPSADARSEVLSYEGNVLDEEELMADLGGDSSVLSAFIPSENLDMNHQGSSAIHGVESSGEMLETSAVVVASIEHALRALREENAKLIKVVATEATTAKERHEE